MGPQRHWCVTFFKRDGPSAEIYEQLRTGVFPLDPLVRYAVWQEEQCPETGKAHMQLYIELARPVRFTHLQKQVFKELVHCEARSGSRQQAREYCRKEESRIAGPWEYGVWLGDTDAGDSSGRSTDLERLIQGVRSGMTNSQLWEQHPAAMGRHFRAVDRYRIDCPVIVRREAPEVLVLWGESGTGKTREAHRLIEERGHSFYNKMPGDWWCGYSGQDAVIIDDFYGNLRYTTFLQVLDRYPGVTVEIKGGNVHFTSKLVIITSNKHPREWYKVEDKKPILRRISKIYHYTQDGVQEEDPHAPTFNPPPVYGDSEEEVQCLS